MKIGTVWTMRLLVLGVILLALAYFLVPATVEGDISLTWRIVLTLALVGSVSFLLGVVLAIVVIGLVAVYYLYRVGVFFYRVGVFFWDVSSHKRYLARKFSAMFGVKLAEASQEHVDKRLQELAIGLKAAFHLQEVTRPTPWEQEQDYEQGLLIRRESQVRQLVGRIKRDFWVVYELAITAGFTVRDRYSDYLPTKLEVTA